MSVIHLAYPRGFCAGVDRAISIVEKALETFPAPLYVHHEIVHNTHVVESLKLRGVIFVEELSHVPHHSTVIFSAHGVSPDVIEVAKSRNLKILDATCPLVTKVHIEARRYDREGYQIVLIGHRNHVEAIGTQGEAPEKITIVETEADIDRLHFSSDEKIAYLTQTTLSVRDTRSLIQKLKLKFPNIEGPASSDICYATTNRQLAVEKITREVDLMLVIGSKNSSNSNRLRELAKDDGTTAYLIDSATDLQDAWFSEKKPRVGLTAGASAPEILVQNVIKRLKDHYGYSEIKEIRVTEEDVVFKLPKALMKS